MPGKESVQVIEGPKPHGVAGLRGRTAYMRQEKGVLDLKEGRIDVRFALVDVKPGGGELSAS